MYPSSVGTGPDWTRVIPSQNTEPAAKTALIGDRSDAGGAGSELPLAGSSRTDKVPDCEAAATADQGGKNRRVGIGVITVALLAVAAYFVFGVSAEKHTLIGDLSLSATNSLSPGDSCTGVGGYSDIHEGTQVVVEDETGKTLATSAFGPGSYDGQSCVFTFHFSDLPRAAFYRIHQSGNRGVLQYAYRDLVVANWSVHLTLGDNSGTN